MTTKAEGGPRSPDLRRRLRGLRTLHLFLLLPWIAVVVAARQPVKDNSFLWHIRAGTLQLDGGEVLRADPFSFTYGGRPWRTQSWLADLLYGVLERGFGSELDWAAVINIVAMGLALVIVGVHTWRRSRSVSATAAGLFLLGWLSVPYVNPRPVLFSYLLMALLALALETKQRWAIPLVVWVWAAVHGSFVIGIGLIVLDAIRRRDRRQGRVLAVSMVTASLTAHGLAIWQILLEFGRARPALRLISEWQPPNLLSPATIPYAALILLVLIGLSNGWITRRDLWVVAPFLLFGLTSGRSVIVAAIVLTPMVGAVVARAASGRAFDRPRPGSPPAVLVAVLGGVILLLPFGITTGLDTLDQDRFPVAAVQFLEPVRTFHTDVDGGYLIFASWPNHLVFTDDRAELYGGEFFREFVDARAAVPGWEDLFEEWSIEQVLVRTEAPLAGVLALTGEWREVYRDANHVVFRLSG